MDLVYLRLQHLGLVLWVLIVLLIPDSPEKVDAKRRAVIHNHQTECATNNIKKKLYNGKFIFYTLIKLSRHFFITYKEYDLRRKTVTSAKKYRYDEPVGTTRDQAFREKPAPKRKFSI